MHMPAAVQMVWLWHNHLSGALPTWSNLGSAKVYVKPGNDGLCGVVSGGCAGKCGVDGA